jgi:uncharacterized membrane protein (UPF0127 family)
VKMAPVGTLAALTAALTAVLIATACGEQAHPPVLSRGNVTFATDPGGLATLGVRIADTPAERQAGLAGLPSLPSDSGMAFVFPAPSTDEFWMKDTLIPLSVAFVRPDGTVAAIAEMAPCTADPCPTYASPEPYMLAVEANPRWFRTNHIVAGSTAVLKETSSG